MPDEASAWSLVECEGEDENEMYLIRVRENPDFDSGRNLLVRVIWEFEAEAEDVEQAVNEAANHFEQLDRLFDESFERAADAVLTHVVTQGLVRQWCFYAKNSDNFMRALNKALSAVRPLPLQIEAEDDKDWLEYHQFASLIEKD